MSRMHGLLAATVGVALGLLAWSGWSLDDAGSWQSQFVAATDPELARRMYEATESGPPGLDALVESLSSSRATMAREAERQLTLAIDRWELLTPTATAWKLAPLAEALASRIETLDEQGRGVAANLALRMLLAKATDDENHTRVLEGCETILKHAKSMTPAFATSQPVLASQPMSPHADVFAPADGALSPTFTMPPPVLVATKPAELPDDATAAARKLDGQKPIAEPTIVPAAAHTELR